MRKVLIGALAISILFLFFGCTSLKTISGTPMAIPNNSLQNGVKIASIATGADGPFLTGIVKIKNTTNTVKNIQYKFIWVNKNGVPNSKNPWIPLQLYPNLAKVVTSVAPTRNDINFKVILSVQKK